MKKTVYFILGYKKDSGVVNELINFYDDKKSLSEIRDFVKGKFEFFDVEDHSSYAYNTKSNLCKDENLEYIILTFNVNL